MVFTRTCNATRLLALMLRNLGLRAIPISGQMIQTKRLGALNNFKAGECNILICIDVASRGLDILSVNMVINYDIPQTQRIILKNCMCWAIWDRYIVSESVRAGVVYPDRETDWQEVAASPRRGSLLLLEHVTEAKRLSQMKIKETGGNKRRGGEGEEEDVEKFLGKKKNSKRHR